MKRFVRSTVPLVGLAIGAVLIGVWGPAQAEGKSEVRRGFQLAPVPLDLKRKNRALVGLGSYIVNAQGGCVDCHTSPWHLDGGNPFAGEPELINTASYLGGGVSFGPFVSRNITPDAFGRPAGYTFEEFTAVIRMGVDLKNIPPAPLLQVMPWPVYKEMSERDLRAIYAYLSSIPCLEGGPGAPPFRCIP